MPQASQINEPRVGMWDIPATVEQNRFIYKSLSCFSLNVAVGCEHACRFCYVADASTRKLAAKLAGYGVLDPDAEWGDYVLLRPYDEKKFLASVQKAENTPVEQLNADGNRAIIISSTTDPYQVVRHPDRAKQRELSEHMGFMVRRSLELIRDHSTLNVRILTRSPLARRDFDILRSFGPRAVFGMSLPTLSNHLAKIYEPRAPAPSQRLATLKAAKEAGLHVFVAVAPTYPECSEEDLRATLKAVAELDPITIFMEPINIRAENVERIATHARSLGVTLNTGVFATTNSWRRYALQQLTTVERLARELGIIDRLHLWPDPALGSKAKFLELRREGRFELVLPQDQKLKLHQEDERAYTQLRDWLTGWWTRISEWPDQPHSRALAA